MRPRALQPPTIQLGNSGIDLTEDQFIDADFYEEEADYLIFRDSDELPIATFTPGFWKAVMPATKNEIEKSGSFKGSKE